MAKGRKTGGRKKGTPNKNKHELLEQIRREIGHDDYHPVVEMARQAVKLREELEGHGLAEEMEHRGSGDDDPAGKAFTLSRKEKETLMQTANKEVAQYVAPKLKAVEVSGTGDDGSITVMVRKFSKGGD